MDLISFCKQYHDEVYTHIFEPHYKMPSDKINVALQEVGVVVEPTTNSLHALIPKIWAQSLERNLLWRLLYDWEGSLTPEEKELIERKRKNRAHYYRYMAWVKKQPKRKKRKCR